MASITEAESEQAAARLAEAYRAASPTDRLWLLDKLEETIADVLETYPEQRRKFTELRAEVQRKLAA